MSYFSCSNIQCQLYPSEWQRVIEQIQDWPDECRRHRHSIPEQISHHLEAKALYVFTIARRFVRVARWLACIAGNWERIFIEATSILFPMIELVGHARVARRQGADNLWAGFHWLRDPDWFPELHINAVEELAVLDGTSQIGHLITLRNYYLHGSKNVSDRIRQEYIADIINAQLPEIIARLAERAMPLYWKQLQQDDGTQEWLMRLARADILPLVIQGSGIFVQGLVDPDIVDYLEGCIDIFGICIQSGA